MFLRYRINGAPGRKLKGWDGNANPEQQLPTYMVNDQRPAGKVYDGYFLVDLGVEVRVLHG